MRLCYIADPYSIHSRRWLEYFGRQGHDVRLLSIYPRLPHLEGVTIHYIPTPSPRFLKKIGRGQGWLAFLSSTWRVRSLVRAIEPNVLHAHYVALFGWLALISGFHPLIVHVWGGDILAEQGAFRFPGNWLTPLTLKKADLVVAPSNNLLTIARQYMSPDTEGHVIRFGADLENFKPVGDDSLWKTRLHVSNRPVILSPRPLEPIYNVEAIISAIPHVLNQIPEAFFVFLDYSSGPRHDIYHTKLRQMISETQIEHAVGYIGKVPHIEMPSLYRLSDVVVSMSLSDAGFPVTLAEAMASGVPLVLGDIPHLKELIADGENALMVPPGDSKHLAEAIVRLLGDRALRQKMIAANLDLVKTYGDFESEMKKMERLYEGLT
jgi:glycosyltransferase involved in cell wall biosynthesis